MAYHLLRRKRISLSFISEKKYSMLTFQDSEDHLKFCGGLSEEDLFVILIELLVFLNLCSIKCADDVHGKCCPERA